MINFKRIKAENPKKTQMTSKYELGPFKKGQARFIANLLRRSILTQINAISIIAFRIQTQQDKDKVHHEFSSSPFFKEDTLSILSNVKQIILKGNLKKPIRAKLIVNKARLISAGDIKLPKNIFPVDPGQYISTLMVDQVVEMEFIIANGCLQEPEYEIPDGFITTKAVFMPIQQVSLKLRQFRADPSLELQNVRLIISTDGSITPENALLAGAAQLTGLFERLENNKPKMTWQLLVDCAKRKGLPLTLVKYRGGVIPLNRLKVQKAIDQQRFEELEIVRNAETLWANVLKKLNAEPEVTIPTHAAVKIIFYMAVLHHDLTLLEETNNMVGNYFDVKDNTRPLDILYTEILLGKTFDRTKDVYNDKLLDYFHDRRYRSFRWPKHKGTLTLAQVNVHVCLAMTFRGERYRQPFVEYLTDEIDKRYKRLILDEKSSSQNESF